MSGFEKKLKRLLDADDGKTRYPKRAKRAKIARTPNRVKKRPAQVFKGQHVLSPDANVFPKSDDVDKEEKS